MLRNEDKASRFTDGAWEVLRRRYGFSGQLERVARLLVAGVDNKAAAVALGISPRTVETYVERLKSKCRATSRVNLIVVLVRQLTEASHDPSV